MCPAWPRYTVSAKKLEDSVRGNSGMRWLFIAVVYVRAFVATLKYAEQMSTEERQKTVGLIKKLAELRGLDTSVYGKSQFLPEVIGKIPQSGGVYRFYDGDELKYIGASCTDLRGRLRRHLSASRDVEKAPNRGLADLIASGRASVEWYICPFAGWMEDFELNEHCERYGRQPPLNSNKRGNLVHRCF